MLEAKERREAMPCEVLEKAQKKLEKRELLLARIASKGTPQEYAKHLALCQQWFPWVSFASRLKKFHDTILVLPQVLDCLLFPLWCLCI